MTARDRLAGAQLKVFLAGRVAVERNGVVIDEARFPGRQGRLLFAYLVAEQGRAVPHDELAAALWEEAPPATWEKALSVIVSKLRGLLADAGVDGGSVLTGAFGCYRLDLPEGSWVDVVVAADAAQEAEDALAADDPQQARIAAALAESMTRQPFLPGEVGTWVAEKRRGLADVRGRALSALAEACLRSGDAAEAAKWAEQAIALAPFREVGYRRLMEAHAAAGNGAEALQVYERCRRLLAEELGAYPSAETEAIYRGLLAAPAVPTTAASAAVTPPPDAAPTAPVRRGRRRLVVAVACGAIAAAASVGAAVVALTRGGSNSAGAEVSADSVGIFQLGNGHPIGQIPVGRSPGAVASGGGSLWVANVDAHSVSRVDPVARVTIQTIQVGDGPAGIAFGAGFAWVTNGLDGTVSRIDPAINRVVQTIDVGNGPVGIAYAAGSIWVANTGDGTITRIDAVSGKATTTLPVAATELAFGDGALWASESTAGRLARIDPGTGKLVQTIQVGNGPVGVAFGSGAAWVANSLDGTVSRIDPETNSVLATIPAGNGPAAVAPDPRGIWVSNQYDGTLVRIDPRTNAVVRRIEVGNHPQGVAIAGGDVLVSVRQSGAGHRGGALSVRMNRDVDSIDPAVAYDSTSWPLLRMTNDGLVAFDQTSGLAGTQLVPDLAVSLPAPTDGGRTYTFMLRPNIRYSTGKLVKASDFRSTFERDFRIGKAVLSYYEGIVGAVRCEKHPRRCDLSHGIVPDDAAGTVTFHLRRSRPGVPLQARARLRVRRAGRNAVERDRRPAPAGNRAVHDRALPPEARPDAEAQSVLPRVVEGGATRRLSGQDRGRGRRHAGRRGRRRDPRQG